MELIKKAYAKINLTLEILRKRTDGYHDILSVMHKIPLYDTVKVALSQGEGISLRCDKKLCAEKENLAYRAAAAYLQLLQEKTGETYHVGIDLEKKIPSQAGLAGGSADGAAVLDALDSLIGKLSADEVEHLATRLGSDMPFCLEKYTCALAGGTGSVLTLLPTIKNGYVVVAMPKDRMPTAQIYKLYDEQFPEPIDKNQSLLFTTCLHSGGTLQEMKKFAVNDFETVCFKLSPAIELLKKEMFLCGALVSQMSGSGSSVFGIFDNEKKASLCAEHLAKQSFEEISSLNLNNFPV
jgi:4-diphosphocytidyl-2-C-methyl-D-erythritol kinase